MDLVRTCGTRNPQGCQVFSFKQPSAEELEHDFLWRTTELMRRIALNDLGRRGTTLTSGLYRHQRGTALPRHGRGEIPLIRLCRRRDASGVVIAHRRGLVFHIEARIPR
jgi:hypothetical protein